MFSNAITSDAAPQLSLFGEPPAGPQGFRYAEALITAVEEAALVARFAELTFTPFQFHGFEGKRRVANFGWDYDFSTQRPHPAPDAPAWLTPLRERAAAWAGIDADGLQQSAVIAYAPGAPIGWHRDRPVYEDVIGVSLLSLRTLRLRRRVGERFERASQVLAPRSVYLLRGPVRNVWEHSIPPADELRYSVMFRNLRPSHPARLMDAAATEPRPSPTA